MASLARRLLASDKLREASQGGIDLNTGEGVTNQQ
jgi:hypothetical protein